MNEYELQAAKRGLATEFSKADQPSEFALKLENRFINLDGDAEQRPGLSTIPEPYGNFLFPEFAEGRWQLTHEHVRRDGSTVLFSTFFLTQDVSGNPVPGSINGHVILKNDRGYWEPVIVHNQPKAGSGTPASGTFPLSLGFYTSANTGKVELDRPFAAQFSDKSLFAAPNIETCYYDEALDKILPLNSVLATGQMAANTSASAMTDSNVTNWANETLVATNDLIYNATRNAWAIVTSVGSTELEHTTIKNGAQGLGNTGRNRTAQSLIAGASATNSGTQAQGDRYEIWDLVENDFYPTNPDLSQFDNVVVAAVGTNGETVAVSSNLLDKDNTRLRVGDYVYNSTRNSVQRVASIGNRSGGDGLTLGMTVAQFAGSVSGQTSGDSLIFLKSAVPIASYVHVHYGRAYLVDARDKSRIVISAPDDVRDFTTYQETLQSSSVDYGARQPKGEEILSLDTFQRYLVAAGRRNIYLSAGVDPIADTSGASTDLQPVGLFTQGAAAPRCLANIGSEMLYAAPDGLRRFNVTDILAVDTDNASEVIKKELRNALESSSLKEREIQVIHYPKRNWVMFKVGEVIYNFNYTAVYLAGNLTRGGSWSKFTGRLAQCHDFLLRANGDLLAAWFDQGAGTGNGITYFFEFDKDSKDDGVAYYSTSIGEPIVTDYETAWIGPGNGRKVNNRYVRPFLECDAPTTFDISVIADLEQGRVDDTITVSATGGGAFISGWVVGTSPIGGSLQTSRDKYPLRTYSDYFKVRIQTSGGARNIINKMILYGNAFETR